MLRSLLILAAFLCECSLIAQTTPNITHLKGKFYFFWGYNRARYGKSDLHLYGENYDFTLNNVVARDRQTPFTANVYLNPSTLTIPQCNYGIGFYLNEHYHLSLSGDHMKYVMVTNQFVQINGEIADTDTPYDGSYTNEQIQLKPEFLTFEHTDGLNYINLELNRSDDLLPFLFHRSYKNIALELTEGVGLGCLLPKTNTKLLSKIRYDRYHIAGYGAALKVGLNMLFFKHLSIGLNLKAGYINMPDIRTTYSPNDRGSQHFTFLQDNLLIGWRF
ncbi:MAG: hypothetical protein NW218_10795 [Saprospiraceae bacterium]|nr:hypothetical protein [Saprospiraceae bacterium]